MVEFFCQHCKQNTLDSFAVGIAHNRVLKCDFCMNKFRVSIVAENKRLHRTVAATCKILLMPRLIGMGKTVRRRTNFPQR